MTDSFGARLRRQRERQHITLAHIAASTKIKASLFEGLERDDVSKWPGGIFRRSFVRAYAAAINLDPDEVCQEFLERFPDGEATAANRGSSRSHGSAAVARAATPARPTSPPSPPAAEPSARPVSGSAWGPWVNEPVMRGDTGDSRSDGPRDTRTDADAADDTDEAETTDEAMPRLALADQGLALLRTPLPTSTVMRWRTVALDLGLILVVALSAFIIVNHFWACLAVTSVAYYLLSTLLLGYTPGMLMFSVPSAAVPAPGDGQNSVERALEMRAELTSEPFMPASARPHRQALRTSSPAATATRDQAAHDEDGSLMTDGDLAYSTLPPPVDISTRRVRA